MKVKSICVISDDYPYKGRMASVFVQQLVEAIVDEGISVSVIAPQSVVRSLFRGVELMPRKQIYRSSRGNNYVVHRPYVFSFGKGNTLLYKLVRPYNHRCIIKCLKTIDPQIVYGHFWHNAMKVTNFTKTNCKPLFVACGEGDNALDDWASCLSDSSKIKIRNLITGVISVSTENKRKCLDYGLSTEENTIVLPNCVNDNVFRPIDCSEKREELGVNDKDFVISYTGAFIERKGYNRLAEAIDSLGDEKIKVIFSGKPMDGHPNDMPHCNGIIHCGPVNHEELPKYLCASDVFVLPTLKEGCCNAIVEALACGLPIISSDRPFNEDILNEGNSIKINPESVEDIADAIKRMMTDRDYYLKLRKYSLKHAGDYSIIDRAKKIMGFISKMTSINAGKKEY